MALRGELHDKSHRATAPYQSEAYFSNLSGNSLKAIDEGAFENLPLLAQLDLSRNHLKFIAKNAFKNLTSLHFLLLLNNDIKGSFHLPSNVATLLLRGNAFSLADLKIILRGLKRLVHLDIEYNRMIGPDFTADVFVDLGNIVDLSMGDCDLENIESGTFSRMHNLSRLYLSGTSYLTFKGVCSMESAAISMSWYLSSNQIVSVDDGTFEQLGPLGKL
ncbi:leucine-rich repeat-containing protein 15-like [Acropora millepora]|uniref:leucine-rich repeat-containing protein 15-like n=1 Tax=Acropora millepora TaxID=45264 RepID=UPI001CF53A48|nr:leucine-rich repeat-containing protein 15-like [Acropora millepora]